MRFCARILRGAQKRGLTKNISKNSSKYTILDEKGLLKFK